MPQRLPEPQFAASRQDGPNWQKVFSPKREVGDWLLLEIGMETIEPRVTGNSKKISDALVQRGYEVVSSWREEEISGIVACTHPAHTARELRQRLNAAGVAVSDRAGRLRIASHFYNNDEDIDRLLAALP